MAGFNASDYVDVAERIREFYEKFPEGRLTTGTPPQVVEIGGKPYIWYHARAYRTAYDVFPGDGWAAEPVPGPTQFTLNSELMNAETAAWGRAIVALGFATKKIASAQEVQARQPDQHKPPKAAEKPAVKMLEMRLYELAQVFNPQVELGPVKAKVDEHRLQASFETWLSQQIAKLQASIDSRVEAEQADREAQVESPAFVAPTGKRGEKAAA